MKRIQIAILGGLLLGLIFLLPHVSPAGETPTMVVEEAKFAIEEARKAGAERIAADDYRTAKSWLSEAVSDKRAQKAREYLVAYQNVDPNRVTAKGLGPSQPAATNSTEAGRALNRRVEIAVPTMEK